MVISWIMFANFSQKMNKHIDVRFKNAILFNCTIKKVNKNI